MYATEFPCPDGLNISIARMIHFFYVVREMVGKEEVLRYYCTCLANSCTSQDLKYYYFENTHKEYEIVAAEKLKKLLR